MTYQWRDLIGSVVGGKYTIGEYLGDVADTAVFLTDAPANGAIVRVAPADRYATRWASAQSLSHPNVVRSFATGTFEVDEDAFDYIVSERPEDSLSDAVQSRSLTADEAREVVSSTLQAAAYLHAQGLTHGAIRPENIVAIGNTIKLAPWTISRSGAPSDDMYQVGETVVEILTQQRPKDSKQARTLPEPFARIAEKGLGRQLTASEALDILDGRDIQPESARRSRVPTAALVAALVVVLAIVFWLRSSRPEVASQPAPQPVTANNAANDRPSELPSPVEPATASRARTVAPPPAKPRADESRWAVVGAIYKDYQGAAKRAAQIAERNKIFQPEVFPPEGEGKRRYMVVLGYAENRKGAEQLLAKAQAAGLPSDAYVTKIGQ